MRVGINQQRCNGAGICVQTCPTVFRFQEGSKKAKVVVEEVPPRDKRAVGEAIELCPTKAIFPVGT